MKPIQATSTQKINTPLASRWTDTLLDYKRMQTDPLGDETVAKIIESGYLKHIRDVFTTLTSNSSISEDTFSHLPKGLSVMLHDYFEESAKLPDWVNPSLIEAGEQVFSLYGPEISMLLSVKALPLCYACAKGAHVLAQTGRLSAPNGNINPLAKRLMETSQMVVNVLSPGGMRPKGNGIITVQKVRLIHASIRYFLKHPHAPEQAAWNATHYGEPINQEDMAGTLMAFSALMLDGLRQLGVELSEEEKNGYMHIWKVVGHLLGLHDDLLANTFEEGWALGTTILRRQAAPSKDGKILTEACIEFLQYMVPGTLFDDVPEYMLWYFLQDVGKATGHNISDYLGLEETHNLKAKVFIKLTHLFVHEYSELEEHSGLVRAISGVFNRKLLQGFLNIYNEGKNQHFFIPPSLKTNWKLN